jgi:hypothetical protein
LRAGLGCEALEVAVVQLVQLHQVQLVFQRVQLVVQLLVMSLL